MSNIQVRLPDDLEHDLDQLAEEMRTNRSETVRRALDQGIRAIRLERALDAYAREEITLSRAAEYAGVNLQLIAREAANRGIPRFRYSSDELSRDAEQARSMLEGSDEEGQA